jgi:hypothetical protein
VGETAVFSFCCETIATARRFRIILMGLSAREMRHPADEKQTRQTAAKADSIADEPRRLPDVLIDDDEQSETCDLPRSGVVKPVVDVSPCSIRLPDVLIED